MLATNRGAAAYLIGFLALGALSGVAKAETRLNAHYSMTMTGVSIGQISWAIDLYATAYTTSANGKASGALSALVNGDGRIATHGAIEGERLRPTLFSSNVTEDGEVTGLQMTFENGAVKTLRTDQPPSKSDRVPVSEADRRGVVDPLTAMLIIAPPGENGLMPAHCNRVLAIFDGQRRYDLVLSFKRFDKMKVNIGYAGPMLVCAVVLKPIAGYRADSMLVKYVGGKSDMEIWFAPITGTAVIAPARVVMPTLIGTLEIAADRFEIAPSRPAAVGEPAK
jgi:hypothetical protein